MAPFLQSGSFWRVFLATFVLIGAFFAWELGAFASFLPVLPRPEPTGEEILFTMILTLLLSLDVGLIAWHRTHGACPVGVRRATGAAGIVGVAALLCPVCLFLPVTVVGFSLGLSLLAPFLPLLQVIAIVLLLVCTGMLLPKKG